MSAPTPEQTEPRAATAPAGEHGADADSSASLTPLNATWTIWFHRLDERRWSMDTYIRIISFSTVHDFWRVMNGVMRVTSAGYYFVMREGILPIYEDPANREGSMWSWRVNKKPKLPDAWLSVLVHLIGDTLYPASGPADETFVTGVSFNPSNSVIKVWLSERLPEAGRQCRVVASNSLVHPDKAKYNEPVVSVS
jgi:hypothetical protein